MTGSTYLDFEKAHTVAMNLIRTGENPSFGLLLVCGVNLGLRVSDLLSLSFTELKNDFFTIEEGKTGKTRTLQVNKRIKEALQYFEGSPEYMLEGYAFTSQKGTRYSSQHVNRLIKKYFKGSNISSHSLRKTFGRRIWDLNKQSEGSLILLSQIFNHRSISDTRRYLGIKDEEIKDVYLNM